MNATNVGAATPSALKLWARRSPPAAAARSPRAASPLAGPAAPGIEQARGVRALSYSVLLWSKLGWGFGSQLCAKRERLDRGKSFWGWGARHQGWGPWGGLCAQDPPLSLRSLQFESCCVNGEVSGRDRGHMVSETPRSEAGGGRGPAASTHSRALRRLLAVQQPTGARASLRSCSSQSHGETEAPWEGPPPRFEAEAE